MIRFFGIFLYFGFLYSNSLCEILEVAAAIENDPKPPGDSVVPAAVKDVEVPVVPSFVLALPTDNDEIFGDPTKFFMHTNRYINGVNIRPWQGGKYGYVRNQLTTRLGMIYTRLHEGIDIRPLKRDRYNTPLDDVKAISSGTVVYCNSSASASNYGRYVVVRHDWAEGAFYSLYAHLASIGVDVDDVVLTGDVVGRMGYSGRGLDRERAHVHLELNFLVSEQFEEKMGYSHKNFNGINMIGLDIGRLYLEHRQNPGITISQLLAGEEPYCKIRTASKNRPGILDRHPWLGKNMEGECGAQCWEFTFAQSGVPLAIAPCSEVQKYASVTWVKDVKTNHSNMTMGRLSGFGDKAKLSTRGYQFIKLISEDF